jgi:hypothetical protein
MEKNPFSKISLRELVKSAGLKPIPIEVPLSKKPKARKPRLNRREERIYINEQLLKSMEKQAEETRRERINPDSEREQALGKNIEELRVLREKLREEDKNNNL